MSSSTGHQLSIYMEDFDANAVFANYSNFLVGDELENYQLTISGFSATPGVGMHILLIDTTSVMK